MDKRNNAKVEKRQESQRVEKSFNPSGNIQGYKIEPQYAIVISLIYVGVVIILHMIGKYKRGPTPVSA